MKLNLAKPGLYILAGFITAACASRQSGQLPLEVLFQSSQCQIAIEETTLIDNTDALRQLLARVNQRQPNPLKTRITLQKAMGENEAEASDTSLHTVLTTLRPTINFSDTMLIFIARGQQPNPGYGIELTAQTARLNNGELQLPISLLSPDPNNMYAQVVVSPCLLLRVTPNTAIERLTLTTQD